MKRLAARITEDVYVRRSLPAAGGAPPAQKQEKAFSAGDPVVILGMVREGFLCVTKEWKPVVIPGKYLEVVPDKELKTLMAEATLVNAPGGSGG